MKRSVLYDPITMTALLLKVLEERVFRPRTLGGEAFERILCMQSSMFKGGANVVQNVLPAKSVGNFRK